MDFNGQFHSDQWHHDAANITIRNNIRSRRWGVRVTVYADPTPANNGEWVLSYGLVDTDIQNNANWFKTADIGQQWGAGAPVVYTFTNGVKELLPGVVGLTGTPGEIVNPVILSSHTADTISIQVFGDPSENAGSDIQLAEGGMAIRYVVDAGTAQSAGFSFDPANVYFVDDRTAPVGLEYFADYSAFYTLRSIPDVEYVNTHFGTVSLSSIAQSPGLTEDGYALVWDNGSLEYTLAQVPTNTAEENELPKTDAGGNLVPSSIASPSAGQLQIGVASTPGDLRDIRAIGSDANISISINGKGNGVIGLFPGSSIDGMVVSAFSFVSILYSLNGTVGADNLLNIRHSAKETGFSHTVTSTEAILRGGHTGTGILSAKRTFSIISNSSQITNEGGDDLSITAGSGSDTIGDVNTPGGNVLISGGIGGNDSPNNGGDIRFSAGAGGGGGNRGNIYFDNIPTSAAGLPSGSLYSNAGILTLAP